ncbi:L-gulono-1-4-lactone dehydrogenase [Nymphaea thermarum]|nr:L-gulono-1-4-lactone dehydrogenase [Nymphaea thermarum]
MSSFASCIAWSFLFGLVSLISRTAPVTGSPPGPVVHCTNGNANCTVQNGYGEFTNRKTCWVAAVAYPTTEDELLLIVSNASKANRKMKIATRYSHNLPRLCCPGGPPGTGLSISTEKLNGVVRVDAESMRMTVESGITLYELIEAAAANGLALPTSPYWLGLSLGGVLSTGAHGSSLFGKGSAVHEYVVGMRIVVPTASSVDGRFAKVISLEEGDPDLLAAKVSLGVLGAISQVTLQMQPMFKRSITNEVGSDSGFEDDIEQFGRSTEFGDLNWYPAQGKVMHCVDVRVPLTQPGNGQNDFTAFRPVPQSVIVSLRRTEEEHEATMNTTGRCLVARALTDDNFSGGNVRLDLQGTPLLETIATCRLQAAGSCLFDTENGLLTVCGFDPRVHGVFVNHMAFSIPMGDISNFLKDVKKLRDMAPDSFCGIDWYNGMQLRFIRASTAYIAKTSDCVEMDITHYRGHDPALPRLHEDVLEEIEQVGVFKYGGLPHWGKNRNICFLGMKEKLDERIEKFVKVMKKFDPKGLFSSEWSDSVLGLQEGLVIDKPGCALEGFCICSHDSHCAPEKGYFCRPGLVYKKARVCRYEKPIA